jgi:hypothetical protein
LRGELAQRELGIDYTPYERVLKESAAWFASQHPRGTHALAPARA